MINKFLDEVLSSGAEKALPHNLNDYWLERIYIAAKNFLKTAAGVNETQSDSEFLGDDYSLTMLAAVTEIAKFDDLLKENETSADIPEELLFEYISCYSLSIIFESISREGKLAISPPSIETIFDRKRLFEIEEKYPALTEALNTLILK